MRVISKKNKVYVLLSRIKRRLIQNYNKYCYRNNANKGLENLYNVLSSGGIKYHLAFGTLLGIIRDSKLIEGDMDIDFFVYIKNEQDINVFRKIMIDNGYRHKFEFSINNSHIVQDTFEKYGIRFDATYAFTNIEENKNYVYALYGDCTNDVVIFSYSIIEKIKEIYFNNIKVVVPFDAELWLSEMYGSSWRIPDPNYKFWQNPNFKKTKDVGMAREIER